MSRPAYTAIPRARVIKSAGHSGRSKVPIPGPEDTPSAFGVSSNLTPGDITAKGYPLLAPSNPDAPNAPQAELTPDIIISESFTCGFQRRGSAAGLSRRRH